MDYKETMELMKELDKAHYNSLDEASRKWLDEAAAIDKRFVDTYNRAEDAEDAWTRYKLALPKAERDALRSDRSKYSALSGLFFGARDPKKLEQYASMTVDELAQLVADHDAAALAKLDAATYAETVASLEAVDPDRLAAALARMAALGLRNAQQEP